MKIAQYIIEKWQQFLGWSEWFGEKSLSWMVLWIQNIVCHATMLSLLDRFLLKLRFWACKRRFVEYALTWKPEGIFLPAWAQTQYFQGEYLIRLWWKEKFWMCIDAVAWDGFINHLWGYENKCHLPHINLLNNLRELTVKSGRRLEEWFQLHDTDISVYGDDPVLLANFVKEYSKWFATDAVSITYSHILIYFYLLLELPMRIELLREAMIEYLQTQYRIVYIAFSFFCLVSTFAVLGLRFHIAMALMLINLVVTLCFVGVWAQADKSLSARWWQWPIVLRIVISLVIWCFLYCISPWMTLFTGMLSAITFISASAIIMIYQRYYAPCHLNIILTV